MAQADSNKGWRVVWAGTGINLALYPKGCRITGIDLSTSMLDKARERAARQELRDVRLLEMDAARITFEDNAFDIVYAPYLISVVPDPVQRNGLRPQSHGGRFVCCFGTG